MAGGGTVTKTVYSPARAPSKRQYRSRPPSPGVRLVHEASRPVQHLTIPVSNPAITERERGELDDLDLRTTAELIALVNRDDETVARSVADASPQIVAAVEAIVARLAQGGRLVYVGAGSSGLLAALDASEIGPTFGSDQVVALVADGPPTTGTPAVDDEDDADAGIAAIRAAEIAAEDAV